MALPAWESVCYYSAAFSLHTEVVTETAFAGSGRYHVFYRRPRYKHIVREQMFHPTITSTLGKKQYRQNNRNTEKSQK